MRSRVADGLSLCMAFNFCNANTCAIAKTIIKAAKRQLRRDDIELLLRKLGFPNLSGGAGAIGTTHASAVLNEIAMLIDQTNRQTAPGVMKRLEQAAAGPDHARRDGAPEIAQAEVNSSPSPIPSRRADDRDRSS